MARAQLQIFFSAAVVSCFSDINFFLSKLNLGCNRCLQNKGPAKLIQWEKMARLFLHVMSKLFHVMIFCLSRNFYI